MRSQVGKILSRLAFGCLVLAPAVAAAAEEAGHGGGSAEAGNPWLSLAFKFVNLSILAAILYKALKKTVSQGLADRADDVRRELQAAKDAKEAAESKYKEYKEKVANLEDDIRKLRDDFRAEGERQRERILREAEEASVSLARQAEAAGANEVKRARDELRSELGEMAVRLAEEILGRVYTVADQKKAVQQTIENVERVH